MAKIVGNTMVPSLVIIGVPRLNRGKCTMVKQLSLHSLQLSHCESQLNLGLMLHVVSLHPFVVARAAEVNPLLEVCGDLTDRGATGRRIPKTGPLLPASCSQSALRPSVPVYNKVQVRAASVQLRSTCFSPSFVANAKFPWPGVGWWM